MRVAIFALSLACALGCALVVSSCGGSSGSGNKIENANSGNDSGNNSGNNSGGDGDAATQPETDDQKIRRAQVATCPAVCERLVQCSVEDARANLSKEKVAEMRLSELVPKAIDDCNSDCGAKTLSPRQITIMQKCVNQPGSCSDYVTCLDAAKPAKP